MSHSEPIGSSEERGTSRFREVGAGGKRGAGRAACRKQRSEANGKYSTIRRLHSAQHRKDKGVAKNSGTPRNRAVPCRSMSANTHDSSKRKLLMPRTSLKKPRSPCGNGNKTQKQPLQAPRRQHVNARDAGARQEGIAASASGDEWDSGNTVDAGTRSVPSRCLHITNTTAMSAIAPRTRRRNDMKMGAAEAEQTRSADAEQRSTHPTSCARAST